MREYSSQDLRRTLGEILDTILGGVTVAITRNRRPIAVLVPVKEWERLSAIAVGDLAADLKSTVDQVALTVSALCQDPEWGPQRTVYLAYPSNADTKLYAAAADEIARRLGVPRG